MSPEEASAEGEAPELGDGRSCLDRTVGVGFMEEVDALSLEGGLGLLRSLPLGGGVGVGTGHRHHLNLPSPTVGTVECGAATVPASWNRLLSVVKRTMPRASPCCRGQGMKRVWCLVQVPSVSTSILGWKGAGGRGQ